MPEAPTTESQDPLVRLGLIDISRIDIHDHPQGEEGHEPAAAPQPATPAAPSGTDWESDDNPYKQAVAAAAENRQQGPSLNEQVAAVRAKGAELLPGVQAQLVAMGVDEKAAPALAQDYVNSQMSAVIAELNRQNDRQVIFRTGAVQRAAAEKIAKSVSTKEVQVKPEEIVGEPTVDAMQARARTLIETRRAVKFEGRKAAGADRAEGGASAGAISPEVLSKMSPEQKISYGIKHGQY
jgi:hypothetical protein